VLAVVAVIMLTNCTVGPEFQVPVPPALKGFLPGQRDSVPGSAVARGADISARWWEVFRSRSLNRLIQDGIDNNQDLRAAEAAVRAAQANANALRGTLFPLLNASFDASRQQTPGATLTSNVPSGADTYSLHTPQVSVAFVPDVFGGTRRAIESADAQAEAQAFQREAVYLTLSSNIALAAIQEASLRGQIAATGRLIDIQTQLLDILRRQNERARSRFPMWWRRKLRWRRPVCCCRRSKNCSRNSAICLRRSLGASRARVCRRLLSCKPSVSLEGCL